MNINYHICLYLTLALTVVLSPWPADGKCNSCGENGIACVNETSFYNCIDGNPQTTQTFNCPTGKICSRLALKCIEANMGMEPDCNPSKGCGICDGTNMFACTSRTTFAQCNGTDRTSITGTCPEGLTCDSSSAEICVNECNAPPIPECDRKTPL